MGITVKYTKPYQCKLYQSYQLKVKFVCMFVETGISI